MQTNDKLKVSQTIDTRLAARYIFRETMGLTFMGVALFWSAGRLDWWGAWGALAVMAIWILATAYVIFRWQPGLLAERLGPRKGAKAWDTTIMSLLGLVQLVRYILAGLDQRYVWSGNFSVGVQLMAFIVCSLGYLLVVWATASNTYFSQIVRLQLERGQSVVSSGPYRYLRHPAYLGSILFELFIPLLLASWWAYIPSLICAGLLLLRTALEDRMLLAELPGYTAYAARVRKRLLPGIW